MPTNGHLRACVVALLMAAGAGGVPGADFTAQLWHWSGRRILEPGEEQDLRQAGVSALAIWTGLVVLDQGHPRRQVRGGPVVGAPEIPRIAVVRVDAPCARLLEDPLLTSEVIAAVVALVPTGPATSGGAAPRELQIDWDVPSRLLGAYARFLTALRPRLPAGWRLTCTGLPTWLGQPALAEVVAAVDAWVPQAYSNDLPAQPAQARALVMRQPLADLVARCERLGRPFRIGLPTYEQTSIWNPQGRPVEAASPVAAEDLFAERIPVVAQPGDGERILRFTLDRPIVRHPAGSLLLCAQPTVASLGGQIAEIRRQAAAHCQGVSFFRLADPQDLPALTTAQVAAAWRGDPPTGPRLVWRWTAPGTLTVANQGDGDYLALGTPGRFTFPWRGNLPEYAGGTAGWATAFGGLPAAPTHADSVLIRLRFLRAGARIAFPTIALETPPPEVRPVGETASPDEPTGPTPP